MPTDLDGDGTLDERVYENRLACVEPPPGDESPCYGDGPDLADDLTGDGQADHAWWVDGALLRLDDGSEASPAALPGGPGDLVVEDFDDGTVDDPVNGTESSEESEVAVVDASGTWHLGASTSTGAYASTMPVTDVAGLPSGINVPARYVGQIEIYWNRSRPAVFVPADATWHVQDTAGPITFGRPDDPATPEPDNDIPVPAKIGGWTESMITAYRPSDGTWRIRWEAGDVPQLPDGGPVGITTHQVGGPGGIPTPMDVDGDGREELTVYHQDGTWTSLNEGVRSTASFGGGADTLPVPDDYDGDGTDERAVLHVTDGSTPMWVDVEGQPSPTSVQPAGVTQPLLSLPAALDPWLAYDIGRFVTLKGSVSGIVTGDEGPAAGIEVGLYPAATTGQIAATFTAPDGTWTLPDLDPGPYRIRFRDPTDGHAQEWWRDRTTATAATKAWVTAGGVTTADATISPAGSLSGRVLERTFPGTASLAGATVRVYRATGGTVAIATTGPDGSFTVDGLPTGDYLAHISKAGYATEWYADAAHASDGVTLTIPGSATLTLDTGGDLPAPVLAADDAPELSGTLADAQTDAPIAGATIRLYTPEGYVTSTTTDVDGTWAVSGVLRAGVDHSIKIVAAGYTPEWHDGVATYHDATRLTFTGNEPLTATLQLGERRPAVPGDYDHDGAADLGLSNIGSEALA
jgi:hypothetical protein